ncbi:MAG: glucokinase [Chlamydiae bacterium]|nr:glucokinase [Chlamydiota bacterium]
MFMILAGDIGGTNARLAFFENDKIVVEKVYKSSNYESLGEIAIDFLSSHDVKIHSACFGVAGPVKNGECKATNLPWKIDEKTLKKQLGIKNVWLINDLEANGYGIEELEEEEFLVLNPGKRAKGNGAIISAGTGLGEAGIFWDGERFHPFATEGGHSSFAPENQIEIELLSFLMQKYGHVSYERILSGNGLEQIYRFLTQVKKEEKNQEVERAFAKGIAPHLITEFSKKKSCPTCVKSSRIFSEIYGSEAGNLALKMFAISGVYIGGGIAPKMQEVLMQSQFMKRFVDKGRFQSFLQEIPVKIILNESTALLGAASYARKKI